MTGNAAVHEEARWARLQAARKRDDADNAVEAALKEKAAAARKLPPQFGTCLLESISQPRQYCGSQAHGSAHVQDNIIACSPQKR